MVVLAQNTFSIKRLLKEPLSLEFSSDTIAIPASAAGVADLTDAEFSVRVLKDSKELFPVYDESIVGLRNIAKDSYLDIKNVAGYEIKRISFHETIVEGKTYTVQVNGKTQGGQQFRIFSSRGYGSNKMFSVNQDGIEAQFLEVGPFYTPEYGQLFAIFNHPPASATTYSVSLEWVAIYEGEVEPPSCWLPAPEEILSNATITSHNCTAVVIDDRIKLTTLTPGKDTGWVDVEVSYGEGYTTKRRFTWAKVKEGKDGQDGADGKDGASYGNSNLINNGDFRYFSWWWDTIPAISTESNTTRFISIGYSFAPGYPGIQLKKNYYRMYAGDYTVLAKVRNKNSSARRLRIYHESIISGDDTAEIPATGQWVYVSMTFKAIRSDGTLHFLMADNSDNTTIDIAELMLVRGSTVPDFYKPSDEDISRRSEYITDAIKEGSSTDIDGGLVLANVLGMKDKSGDVRSYMSGLVGSNPTAFAAGVENFGTNEETKTIDLRHDGSGHLASGSISWDKDGETLKILNQNSSYLFLITKKEIPKHNDIIASNYGWIEENYFFSKTLNMNNPVEEPMFGDIEKEIIYHFEVLHNTLPTAIINADIAINHSHLDGFGTDQVRIFIEKRTTEGWNIIYASEENSDGGYYLRQSIVEVNEILTAGYYRVRFTGDWGYSSVMGSPASFHIERLISIRFRYDIKQVILGINGLSVFDTSNNDFIRIATDEEGLIKSKGSVSFLSSNKNHRIQLDNTGFSVKGETDMPGVLATGSVASNSIHSNRWGAKVAESGQQITKGDGSGQNTGIYNVPHNVGNTNYTVIAIPTADNLNVRVIGKYANSIRISVKNVSNNYINGSFDYTIMGNN